VLRDLIARTAFAITAEDARYYLAGACFSWTRTAPAWWPPTVTAVLRPPKAALKVPESSVSGGRARRSTSWPAPGDGGHATFQQVENHLVFTAGGRTLASKTVEAQFPAFEKVIAVGATRRW
jgi:DNA polymerase III sliding clamp (beta) subunit (PCNA family)